MAGLRGVAAWVIVAPMLYASPAFGQDGQSRESAASGAERIEALLSDARRFLGLEIFPEALEALSEARAIDPLHPEVHFMIGRLALARDDIDTAEEEFRVSLNLEPASFTPHFHLAGLSIMRLGETPGARAAAADWLARYRTARSRAERDRFSTPEQVVAMDRAATDLQSALLNVTGRWTFHGPRVLRLKEDSGEIVAGEDSSGALAFGSGRLNRNGPDSLEGSYQVLLRDGCTYTENLILREASDGSTLTGSATMQQRSRKGACRSLVEPGQSRLVEFRRIE